MPILSQALLFVAQLVAWVLRGIGLRQLAFQVEQPFLWLVRREAAINDGFREATQSLTAPFGGVLADIGDTFTGLEAGMQNIANGGRNFANTLDNANLSLDTPAGDFEVREINALLDFVAGIFDVIGNTWYAVLNPFSVPFDVASQLFYALAGLSPVEVASGFLGGILLLLLSTVSVPTLVVTLLNLIFVQAPLYVIRSYTRFGDKSKARPTPAPANRLVAPLVNRFVMLIAMVALTAVFLMYPFFNIIGVLMLITVAIAFVILGELQDQATLYAFGLVMGILGIPAFLLEVLNFGIVATVVVGAALLVTISYGTDRLEKEAASIVTETA